MVTVARLRELFSYDPETGVIRWLVDRNNHVKSGDVAGCINCGYRVIGVDGSSNLKAQRIAWALHYGAWPTQRLDHINRDPADNRIANLRLATHAQNIANTQSKRTGRPKGVYWHKQRQRWHSNITVGGKKKHLGLFDTEAEAAAAFARASQEIYGDFSRVEARP